MAHVVASLDLPSNYRDSQARHQRDTNELLSNSSTLYIGNLSFYTTEEQIYEVFAKCAKPDEGGGVKRIIMGLDRNTRTPCGFCFVEFYTHAEALAALRYISGTKLDERIVRCDLDTGYADGRQFGRGKSGGQVRDEHRTDYDAGRGGWGAQAQRERLRKELYADVSDAPGAVAGGGGNWEDKRQGKETPEGNPLKRERDEDEEDVDEVGRSRRLRIKEES